MPYSASQRHDGQRRLQKKNTFQQKDIIIQNSSRHIRYLDLANSILPNHITPLPPVYHSELISFPRTDTDDGNKQDHIDAKQIHSHGDNADSGSRKDKGCWGSNDLLADQRLRIECASDEVDLTRCNAGIDVVAICVDANKSEQWGENELHDVPNGAKVVSD